jgi:GT2 family glycosyltransferase
MAIGITAVVTAHQRVDHLLQTLAALEACEPPPAEILVHVDNRNADCEAAVRRAHPGIRLMVSDRIVGPGGGRNLMLAAAAHPIVASFDDDSRPIDRDYFARLAEVITRVPDAAVVGAAVYHRHEAVADATRTAAWTADFAGGACAYRRDHFLETGGYVPLETAYGMEEVDLALRLHARGRRVLQTPWLRVLHDTDLARHAEPRVTAASVANLALLTYLRYPATMWAVGAGQIVNRIRWLLGHGRHHGVLAGLARIPATVRMHRRHRSTVGASAVRSYLRLRRHPVAVPLGDA